MRRLQLAQAATMFSQTDLPPRLRGITWSTVSPDFLDPQYWQVQESRASTALAGDLAAMRLAGNPHVAHQPNHIGPLHSHVLGVQRALLCCSSNSAFSFSSSTAARLNVQTLIGSYVALRTKTRATVKRIVRGSGNRIGAQEAHGLRFLPESFDRFCNPGVVG